MDSFELCIPPELVESVIDEVAAFSDEPTCSSTLASLALVSHAFRHRVNTHRFREITLKLTHHIRVFAYLLKTDSGSWPPDEQLHAYIRKFKVFVSDSNSRLLRALNSRHMKSILDRIFRGYTQGDAPALSYSFIWDVRVRVEWGLERRLLDWKDFDNNLHLSFLTMIQESCLTEVVLHSLENVPRDVVQRCHATSLAFCRATFASPLDLNQSTEGILDSWHLEHMKKFSTDHSVSPMDYIGTVAYHASPSIPIFPNLKHIICCICNDAEYEMTVALMQRATRLDKLSLTLLEPTKREKHLGYDHFLNLATLAVVYYNPLRPLASNYAELVHNVVDVFRPTIPSVQYLYLNFTVFSTNDYSTNLESIFRHHDFSTIDDFLANSLPPTLEFFQIHICVVVTAWASQIFFTDQFQEEGSEYVQNFFPRLSKLSIISIVTTALTYRRIDEAHYDSHPGYKWKYDWGITED